MCKVTIAYIDGTTANNSTEEVDVTLSAFTLDAFADYVSDGETPTVLDMYAGDASVMKRFCTSMSNVLIILGANGDSMIATKK